MKLKLSKEAREFFRAAGAEGGRIGGKIGGETAAANMTPAQRKARSAKAVAKRLENLAKRKSQKS